MRTAPSLSLELVMRCVTPDWAIKWAIKMKGEPTRKCGPTLPNRKTYGGKTNQNGIYI